jgi:flagellar biosynthesis protein FlhA
MAWLASIYAKRPLDFAAFPTLLPDRDPAAPGAGLTSPRRAWCCCTAIPATAAAGKVIEAFGDFVVGGNYAVGFVVFAILLIINFVVVTKGAGRMAEVSARFTLDAMPGKQMAIDADLNAGIIGQEEARTRGEVRMAKRISTARWTAPASSCAATPSPAS